MSPCWIWEAVSNLQGQTVSSLQFCCAACLPRPLSTTAKTQKRTWTLALMTCGEWGTCCCAYSATRHQLWSFNVAGSAEEATAIMCAVHQVWAESYLVPNAVNTAGAHGILDDLFDALTVPGQYKAAAPLVRHLLHPEVAARATMMQALAATFFL